MRLHTYGPGSTDATTNPDAPDDVRLVDTLEIDVEEHVYVVGDRVVLDVELTLIEIFGTDHGHVVKHHCQEITVQVDYAGRAVEVRAHPADTVAFVQDEAVSKLKITPAVAADLVLRVRGTTENLGLTVPIGASVPKGKCDVVLDLLHHTRPQG